MTRTSTWRALSVACLLVVALAPTTTLAQDAVPAPAAEAAARKAIGNVVREHFGIDASWSYEVGYLKVQDGWAWAVVWPRTVDGTQAAEPIAALLRRQGETWRVAETPCMEVTCPQGAAYFRALRRRFPDVPAAILPRQLVAGSPPVRHE